jgi:hypothetical protein
VGASRRPTRRLRDRVQHAEPALAVDVLPPELVRVDAGKVGRLVDDLLARERQGNVHRRAQRRRLEVAAHPGHPMADDAPVRQGVLVADVERCGRLRPNAVPFARLPGTDEHLGGVRRREGVLPAVVLVGDDLAGRVAGDLDIGRVGLLIVIPPMLVPPHQLQAYGCADLL